MKLSLPQKKILDSLTKDIIFDRNNPKVLEKYASSFSRLFSSEFCEILRVKKTGDIEFLTGKGSLIRERKSLLDLFLAEKNSSKGFFLWDKKKLKSILLGVKSSKKASVSLLGIWIRLKDEAFGFAIYGAKTDLKMSADQMLFSQILARLMVASVVNISQTNGLGDEDPAVLVRRANEDLERFAYIASHDLQEPLRTIESWVQILKKSIDGSLSDNAQKALDFIDRGTLRMGSLLKALLEYSRASRTNIGKEWVPMKELISNAISNLAASISEAGANIEVLGDYPELEVESALMTSVFQNIIGNAIKFRSDQPPRVTISCEYQKVGDEWIFKIADNGIEIDSSQVERVFEPFKRLNPGKFGGTGIGLSIVKKVVERHRGRVWIEPNMPRGSSFYFSLPAP